MSTAYYHVELCDCECPYCPGGRVRYIGHSAAGWKFAWREYEDVKTIEQAESAYRTSGYIVDEYDRPVTWQRLVDWDRLKMDGRWYEGEYAKDRIDRHGRRWFGYGDDCEGDVHLIAKVREMRDRGEL